MKYAFTALAALGSLIAAQPAIAQAQPAAQAPPPPTPQQREAALRQIGFSPAGIALMQRSMDSDRAIAQSASPDIQAGKTALVAAVQATPFNAARFEQLLRDQQTRVDRLTAQLAGSRAALLRSLPASDQVIFARLLILGAPRPAAPPAAPAPRAK